MRIDVTLGWLGSAVLAALASGVVTFNAFSEESHPVRIGVLLAVLIALHLMRYPRLAIPREIVLYLAFLGYLLLSLLWTENRPLAGDTMILIVNFLLVMILFSALITFHDRRPVLSGYVAGFLAAALLYSRISGYPFVYPEGFSYNSIAGMYLFGLILVMIAGWHFGRTLLPLLMGTVLVLLIAATTSIKTNVGIGLGLIAAAMFYFPSISGFARRYALPFVALLAILAYAVLSSAALFERVEAGYTRVSTGVEILIAREDETGATELGAREEWKDAGIRGWVANPVFGYGVEAFRNDIGITSHSTPIDLLYNSGAIGLVLFYSLLGSILWRLRGARSASRRGLFAMIFAVLVCYAFITLSGTMYYDYFMAAFVATSASLIPRWRPQPHSAPDAAPLAAR
ncbi:MAG: hypothetical protein ABI885_01270 [Gammaproteobacteria bacterium]